MSWFSSIPLPNPLKALQFSDDESESQVDQPVPQSSSSSSSASPSAAAGGVGVGVKEDLSALGESIGRQLRGVASFLSPDVPEASSSDDKLAGIRKDLAEIGGTFKSSLSLLPKLASDFLHFHDYDYDYDYDYDDHNNNNNHLPIRPPPFIHNNNNNNHDDNDDDDDDYDYDYDEYEGPGITDDVVHFAAKISHRPELWTDFPLSIQPAEFNLSDSQSEHVSVIEELVPSLADLRSRLVSEISEKQFWVIYFILLLPRLTEDDLELLSTPEIIEARETLLRMLRSKNETETNSETQQASDDSSNVVNKVEEVKQKATISESSTESRSRESNESAPKKILEDTDNQTGGNSGVGVVVKKDVGNNDFCSEDEEAATSSAARKVLQSEDDVSFSDLEDDDDDTDRPNNNNNHNRAAQSTRASSPEWVQLNKGAAIMHGSQSRGQLSSRDTESGEESNDWLTVDDFDP